MRKSSWIFKTKLLRLTWGTAIKELRTEDKKDVWDLANVSKTVRAEYDDAHDDVGHIDK